MVRQVPGWLRAWGARLIGLVLLVLLLIQVDIGRLMGVLQSANPLLVLVALLTILPMMATKTMRWLLLLRSQGIVFGLRPALLAYLGSMFIGLLTPGRLGEFVKALHVSRDCNASSARAFSSVLADRLFDLVLLLAVGTAALLTLAPSSTELLTLLVVLALFAVPLGLFLNDQVFGQVQRLAQHGGRLGQRIFAPDSWLVEMRAGMQQLSPGGLLLAAGLTVLAYLLFFGQCYLLALALGLPLSYSDVSFAVALGSLVTLLPISISGLGTREATLVAYLGTLGVAAAQALGFSLLVFATFYLGGGLLGAIAWWLKPVSLATLRRARATPR